MHLGDISAAKRTLKKAYKMAVSTQEGQQEELANLLRNGILIHTPSAVVLVLM